MSEAVRRCLSCGMPLMEIESEYCGVCGDGVQGLSPLTPYQIKMRRRLNQRLERDLAALKPGCWVCGNDDANLKLHINPYDGKAYGRLCHRDLILAGQLDHDATNALAQFKKSRNLLYLELFKYLDEEGRSLIEEPIR